MPLDLEIVRSIDAARQAHAAKSIRLQFGETLLRLGEERTDFIVLTADLMYATGIEAFGSSFPKRIYNVGIAEQNMAGIAAGLALCGKLPIVSGYAAFTSLRAVEQAKLDAAYNGVKVIFAAQSAGLSYGVGGPTHQTYEDIAVMRAIPNMIVVVPSDAHEIDSCMRAAIDHVAAAPIYIRLGRGPEPLFNAPGTSFAIGKAITVREGAHISLITNGSMVFEAMLASDYLAARGIDAGVLNVHTVKPVDRDAIMSASNNVEAIIVIEEHSTMGGLGSAVLEVLSEVRSAPVRLIGIGDAFPPVGPPAALRKSLGLCAENIVFQVLDMLSEPAGHLRPIDKL